ncbi:putative zinc finger MYM-type protein 1-like [Triplophysa rosa]|uniref:Zinc finger MYM-type protein 1-like n=1 Tax=Triplophysa rosa TaxID=992332 RepID=A0A9W7T5T2_TRIRA|nr:putative zinc finger MYM-type protein 1-like [Triplophysa rosa]
MAFLAGRKHWKDLGVTKDQIFTELRLALLSLPMQKFGKNTTAAADELNLERPAIPRPRKIPRRLDTGVASPHMFQSPEAMYRQQYNETVDTATSSLDCRFSQTAFKHMQDIEDFVTGKGDCKTNLRFYGDDLDESRLRLHRDMCIDTAKQRGVQLNTFQEVVGFLKGDKGDSLRTMLPELTKLVKLALTAPVTSCTSERSFSGLRRLKTYLRSRMGQGRLNHIVILNCHKNMSRNEHLDLIADEFIKRTATRRNTFLLKN